MNFVFREKAYLTELPTAEGKRSIAYFFSSNRYAFGTADNLP
jgi:hypothetical protein